VHENASPRNFKAEKIALRLPIMHDVIAGKTLVAIARKRGVPVSEIDNLFGQFMIWLQMYCDPYFAVQHRAAVAVRPGVGLPRLVREHATLYLDLAARHARMVSLSKRLPELDDAQLRTMDITSEDMFPPYLKAEFASKKSFISMPC